jgi:hypothetical protein
LPVRAAGEYGLDLVSEGELDVYCEAGRLAELKHLVDSQGRETHLSEAPVRRMMTEEERREIESERALGGEEPSPAIPAAMSRSNTERALTEAAMMAPTSPS